MGPQQGYRDTNSAAPCKFAAIHLSIRTRIPMKCPVILVYHGYQLSLLLVIMIPAYMSGPNSRDVHIPHRQLAKHSRWH